MEALTVILTRAGIRRSPASKVDDGDFYVCPHKPLKNRITGDLRLQYVHIKPLFFMPFLLDEWQQTCGCKRRTNNCTKMGKIPKQYILEVTLYMKSCEVCFWVEKMYF